MDVDIEGAQKIALVGAAIRKLGTDRKIVNNMNKEIRKAVPALRALIKSNALRYLPGRNGLAAWVAKARISSRVRRSASNAGVTVVGGRNSQGARSDLASIDAGTTRAPFFGDRREWHDQAVKPNFFGDAVDEGSEAFREAIVRAVDDAVEETLRSF